MFLFLIDFLVKELITKQLLHKKLSLQQRLDDYTKQTESVLEYQAETREQLEQRTTTLHKMFKLELEERERLIIDQERSANEIKALKSLLSEDITQRIALSGELRKFVPYFDTKEAPA